MPHRVARFVQDVTEWHRPELDPGFEALPFFRRQRREQVILLLKTGKVHCVVRGRSSAFAVRASRSHVPDLEAGLIIAPGRSVRHRTLRALPAGQALAGAYAPAVRCGPSAAA